MIPESTVQKIIEAANVVEVIQDFVSLKRAGVNYKGNCPFHDEKTPSFVVSPAKGIYKCFGCGAAGNSVKFIMEHEKFSFVEALKYLGKKYHIEIEEKVLTQEEAVEKKERESLLIVNEYAKKYFVNQLLHTQEGKTVGLSYYTERGFSEEIINKFELGWSPKQRDALTKDSEKRGYKLKFLEITGLTITKQETNYSFDRFAERIMFPIHSLAGKIIGFGGRTLKADKKIAKYLNSPESEVYNKSRILYGLYFAKNAIVKLNKCYMVEGYTDVISMYQSGVQNVVASSGTSLTESQIRLVRKFTENLTIIYDGDFAGIKASLRGIDMVLAEGMNVKIVLLPDGEDPDSYSKKMKFDEFQKYIDENEQDFIKFKTKLLIEDAQDDPVKKATHISDIVKSISVIDNMILRAEYIKECSSILKIREEVLYAEVKKRASNKFANKPAYSNRQSNQNSFNKPSENANTAKKVVNVPIERDVIYYMLNYGDNIVYEDAETNEKQTVGEYIVAHITNDELIFKNITYNAIFEEYSKMLSNSIMPKAAHFISHVKNDISTAATDIISPEQELSKIWTKNGATVTTIENQIAEIVPDIVDKFKLKNVQFKLVQILEEIKNIPFDADGQELIQLLDEYKTYDEYKIALTKQIDKSALL